MQTIFKWIDRFFHSIPEGLARNIRFGAIGLWAVAALGVSYRACVSGQAQAPQQGQDLQMSGVKENIVKEENRKNGPRVQLPDPDQILPEKAAMDSLPLPEPSRDPLKTLPDSGDLREHKSGPDSESLPPFLGESDQIIFPSRDAKDNPARNLPSDKNNDSSRNGDLEMIPSRNDSIPPTNTPTTPKKEQKQKPGEDLEMLPFPD